MPHEAELCHFHVGNPLAIKYRLVKITMNCNILPKIKIENTSGCKILLRVPAWQILRPSDIVIAESENGKICPSNRKNPIGNPGNPKQIPDFGPDGPLLL